MSRFAAPLSGLSVILLAGACGGSGVASPTERLWVSAVPTSTKQELSAFVTTRTGDGKYIGAFFHGSALRGSHDVFAWKDDGKGGAVLEFLQDGRIAKVRFETCTPTRGFDHCLIVHGDPTGAQRYQSRKRWTVRRPGKKTIDALLVPQILVELAQDDDDLAAAVTIDDADAS